MKNVARHGATSPTIGRLTLCSLLVHARIAALTSDAIAAPTDSAAV